MTNKQILGDRALDLETHICIQKEKISPRHAIVRGIEFQVTPEVVEQVQRAKSRGKALQFKTSLLTELRDYVLSNDAIAFSTSYRENEIEETVMHSLISLDGEISHQVCDRWLEEGELALKIASCHHWFVQQVLRGLPIRPRRSLAGLAWGIAALVAAGIVALNWQKFLAGDAIAWSILFLMMWLIQRALSFLLNRSSVWLRRWLLRQILFGAFSRDDGKRKRAFAIVERL
ncbi:MAG: hypothetical protein SVX43_02875 [Cyanobacteriota bacterium]|nr:hypothetical protein [Cyanobacteriota bacterium]